MKKYLPYGVALVILGMTAAPLVSQTQTTTSSSSSGYIQTSKIIGTKVKTQSGEEVGVVKDVVIDRGNGCMAYTVLSAGGGGSRVTGQSKLVAVPWSVYTVSPDASYLTTTIERDRIYNAPVFEYSRINDASFTSTVYSSFGASPPSVGFGASTNTTGATTTVGATTQTQQTQTGPYASPGASAAPGATGATGSTGSTGATGSTGVGASPSATASASPEASASAPSKSSRGAKGGNTPVPSPRRHRDETMKGTGATNEEESTGGTSSSGTKKSSKKGSSEETSSGESSADAGESPSGKKTSHKKSSTKTEGTETAPSPGEQE